MKYPDDKNNFFSTKQIEDFFEEALCGYVVANPQGFIFRANKRMVGWLGFGAEEFTGKRFSDLLTIGGKIYFETHLWPLLRMQGFFEEVLMELRSETGEKMRVLTNARECRDEHDAVYAIHFTIIKASDRLQYEQNLQQLKTAAERELNHQKEMVALREQLIAVLGHDLRNPLNAVMMVAELLPETKPGADFDILLSTLKRSTHRMKELINNIMDFARPRMGEGMQIDSQEILIEPMLQQVVQELQLIFPKRKISSNIYLPNPVYCDPHRVSQLLSNLLANAITHGYPDKPVLVEASQNTNSFELSVTNAGKPIPEELRN